MSEPKFSGPSTRKMVTAISQDLDELGFIWGKEYIAGPRNSGRTERMLRDALHQLDFMDPGDEIWVVTHNWNHAKRLAERTAELAVEMRYVRRRYDHPDHQRKTLEGWKTSASGLNKNRYFFTFKGDRHIHFCSIIGLEHALRGRRMTHSPCIFIDHSCYEFGHIQNADFDLYALLDSIKACC